MVWDRETGEPVYNAIVWQDTRTDAIVRELAGDEGVDRLREVDRPAAVDLLLRARRSSGSSTTSTARASAAENGELAFGTMDTWVLWNLTGGKKGGVHVTDVTNAVADDADGPRDARLARAEPRADGHPAVDAAGDPVLVARPTARRRARRSAERPVAGILGDQHAALFGQTCFDAGDAKNTYGTGSFLLVNTGEEIVRTDKLLTTVGYKLGDGTPIYVLEGSIAVTGALIQWLRDRLKIIDSAPEVEELAKTVDDNGGVYFVPAFSGLFAPYWRDDARGVIVGLTAYANQGHIARAALEADRLADAARWSTRPTTSPTSRSPSCASTAA